MDKKTEALKLALEALERYQVKRQDFDRFADEITAIREALAPQPAPVAEPHKQQELVARPDCWVCVKDGKIIGFYDRPFTLAGIEAVRYVHHEEVESLAIENIRLQNLVKDLSDWNDSLKEQLSYREAYPANFTRDWVGLTDGELRELEKEFEAERVRTSDEEYLIIYPSAYWSWMRAMEAKLKEKNT